METKLCTTCLKNLPLTAFYRRKNGQSRGATCKACENKRTTAWRHTPKGKVSALKTSRKYNASKMGQTKRKVYRQTDAMKAARLRWEGSPEGQAWLAEYRPAYRKSDKRKAVLKRYYEGGKGKAALKRYQQTAKGVENLLRGVHKRRQKLQEIRATLTAQQWADIKTEQQHRCAICGQANLQLTRDHIVALSRGGEHVAENIQAVCRSCNSRKGNRLRAGS